jgi:hypothetical protein
MSRTLTLSDALLGRLEAAARRRGLSSVEQLLKTWESSEQQLARFRTLAERWKRETAHLSNIAKKALHPAYQEIIGMGESAVPLLLTEFQRQPDDWFWALHAITGANPVPPTSRGNLRAMAEAWVQWGVEHGLTIRCTHSNSDTGAKNPA